MSDPTVDSEPGNGTADDLLDLLATPVSKDYINCVWSNEPLENGETSGSPKKTSSAVSDHKTVSDNKTPDQAISCKNTVVKGKSSSSSKKAAPNSDHGSVLKKSVKKRKLPQEENSNKNTDKVSLPGQKVIKVKKLCAKELNSSSSAQIVKSTLVENPIKSVKNLQSVHSSKVAKSLKSKQHEKPSEEDEKLFLFYKSLVNSSLPPYQPKEINPRFFSGQFFICRACGDKYVLQTSLFGHMSRKSAKFSYQCPVCLMRVSFDNRCTLLLHIKSHGMDVDSIKVGELIVTPLSSHLLDVSVLFKHTSLNNVRCPECDRIVNSSKLHFQGKDEFGPKASQSRSQLNFSFSCKECPLKLPTKCALAAHERFHKGAAPFLCPDCGEVFIKSSILLMHMQEKCHHHLKKLVFQCGQCGLVVHSSRSLEEHHLTNHVRKIHICDFCEFSTDVLDDLKIHRKEHMSSETDPLPDFSFHFNCDECPGVVIEKDSIKGHVENHSSKCGRTVFQCDVCQIILESSDSVLNHKCSCQSSHLGNGTTCVLKEESCSNKLPEECTSIQLPKCAIVDQVNQSSSIESMETSPLSRIENNLQCVTEGDKALNDPTDIEKNSESVCGSKTENLKNEAHNLQSGIFTQNAMCKLCKKIVAEGIDKVAIKKHFLSEHLDIFMNAVRGKISGQLPMQIVLTPLSKTPDGRNCKSLVRSIKFNKKHVDGSKSGIAKIKQRKKVGTFAVSSLRSGSAFLKVKDLNVSSFKCYKCSFASKETDVFKKHITTHKSNPSDLQCPECGLCFIVRPPLEKHLLVKHCIKNVDQYMTDHGFVEHTSEEEEQIKGDPETDIEHLEENQCKVCKEKFESTLMLERHFRVHGGAFLLSKLKEKRTS